MTQEEIDYITRRLSEPKQLSEMEAEYRLALPPEPRLEPTEIQQLVDRLTDLGSDDLVAVIEGVQGWRCLHCGGQSGCYCMRDD